MCERIGQALIAIRGWAAVAYPGCFTHEPPAGVVWAGRESTPVPVTAGNIQHSINTRGGLLLK